MPSTPTASKKPKGKEKDKDKEGEKEKGKSRASAVVGNLLKAATRKSGGKKEADNAEGAVSLEANDVNGTEVAAEPKNSRRSSESGESASSKRPSQSSSEAATLSPVSPLPQQPTGDPTTSSFYSSSSGTQQTSSSSGSSQQPKGRRPSKTTNQACLYASQSIEDFLAAGLLPIPGASGDSSGRTGLLEVAHTEPIASVVERLHQWRLRSCIVSFSVSKKEFFDCMDLMFFILQEVNDNDGSDYEDWEVMKSTLRRVADSPISQAIRPPRGSCEFRRLDTQESLLTLLENLRTLRRVPVYRKGELCRIVTASDILEMCCCVSEDTKGLLEKARLTDMMSKSPGMISSLSVAEDYSLLEVLQSLKDTNIQVVPVVEGMQRISSFDTVSSAASNLSAMLAAKSEALQKDPGRSLVGQFDVASLRVLLVSQHERKDGSWWWEDAAVNTKNIMMEPCMDFLALGGSVIVTSSVAAPYNAVQAEETLARAIGRILASAYQSVVVYPPSTKTDNESSPVAGKKAIAGIVSTHSLVIAMLEGGTLHSLKFDPSKPRRVDTEDAPSQRQGGVRTSRNTRRPPTLTNIQLPGPMGASLPEAPSHRDPKVKFNNIIDLDYLGVPTCPDHGVRFMKFVQDENAMFPLDFHQLMDVPDHSKVAGATAQCLSCQRLLGRITARPKPKDEERPRTPPRLFSLGEMASSFGNVFGDSVPFLKRTGSGSPVNGKLEGRSPVGSALKAGTAYPLKKSKTAERLEALRAQEEARTGTTERRGGFFFGRCCSPCRCLSDKEQIASSVSVTRGLSEPDSPPSGGASPLQRSNSGRESASAALRTASGRNSPSDTSPLLAGSASASGSGSHRASEKRNSSKEGKKRQSAS